MKNTTRNNDLWKKKRERLKTTYKRGDATNLMFMGGDIRMYKKPQPIVLKGWAVTDDFSY